MRSTARADRPQFHVSEDPESQQYRELSTMAVVSLLLGIGSATALLTPAFWFVPVIGVVLSLVALQRVAHFAPALIGRKAALWGLALSLGFLVAGVTSWTAYRAMLREEAATFGQLWFAEILADRPQVAMQLMEAPSQRRPLDESLWKLYAPGTEPRESLEQFVARKDIRTLLAVAGKARVRYFATERHDDLMGNDIVVQTYAVTFENDEGELQTFFVELTLMRSQETPPGRSFWTVRSASGGVTPHSLSTAG